MNLREYEWFRNPRGLHNNGAYHPFEAQRYLRPRMGWARLVVGGDEYVHHAAKLVAGGCTPIVRIHRSYMGAMPVPEAWYALYQEYYDAGCRWFELYDRPNAPEAWPKDPDGGPRVDLTWENHEAIIEPLVDNWIDWAERILELGGYPAFPAMAPRDDRTGAAPYWIDAMLRYLKAVHNDRFLDVLDNGLWCATVAEIGNRFYQEPPGGPDHVARPFYQESAEESGWHFEYPYDPILQRSDPRRTVFGGTSAAPHADTRGLTAGGEAFQEMLLHHFTAGPVPVVATSGGITPVLTLGDEPAQPDELYPPYDAVAHGEATLAMWNWVATVGPPWFFGATLSNERAYYPGEPSPAIERMIAAAPVLMEVADIECGVTQAPASGFSGAAAPADAVIVDGQVVEVDDGAAGAEGPAHELAGDAFAVVDSRWIDDAQEAMDEEARDLVEDESEVITETWIEHDDEALWVEPEEIAGAGAGRSGEWVDAAEDRTNVPPGPADVEELPGDTQGEPDSVVGRRARPAAPESEAFAEGIPEWLEPYAGVEEAAPAPAEEPAPEQLPLMPEEAFDADAWVDAAAGDPFDGSEEDIELETGTELSEAFDEEPILEDADEAGELVDATQDREDVPSWPIDVEELPDDMQEELAAVTGAEEPEELAEEVEADEAEDLDGLEADVEDRYGVDLEAIEAALGGTLYTADEAPPEAPPEQAPAAPSAVEGIPEWLGTYTDESSVPEAEPEEDVPEWLEEFLFADVGANGEAEAGEGLPGWLWEEFERAGAPAAAARQPVSAASERPAEQAAGAASAAVIGQTLEDSADLPGGDPGEPPDAGEGMGPLEGVVVIPGPAAPEVDEHWLIIAPGADLDAFFDGAWRYWQTFRPTVAYGWGGLSLIPASGVVAVTVLCPVDDFEMARNELLAVRPQATLDLVGSDIAEELQAELNWRAMTESRLG